MREHRLSQADWLLRDYGFSADDIVADPATGMLALDIDPKLAWALAHRQHFPVDLNRAPREMLLRVPGLGLRTVQRRLQARRVRRLRLDDLQRLRVPHAKVRAFAEVDGHTPRALDSLQLAGQLAQARQPRPSAFAQQVQAAVALGAAASVVRHAPDGGAPTGLAIRGGAADLAHTPRVPPPSSPCAKA